MSGLPEHARDLLLSLMTLSSPACLRDATMTWSGHDCPSGVVNLLCLS